MKKILLVFGTRPEAIKMAHLALTLLNRNEFETRICVSGQHREMLDQVLNFFEIRPDYDLNVMTKGQDLTDITLKILTELKKVFSDFEPDCVMVHGDTTTTLSASLSAYYHKIPVFHVEAGLRTGNIYSPWPEEINRKITGTIAAIHFAPTSSAKNNLLKEGVEDSKVFVTGNTVIDSLLVTLKKIENTEALKASIDLKLRFVKEKKKIILVTGHRRENFGDGFENICNALNRISQRNDVQIIYPVHFNPKVQEPVRRILGGSNNIELIEPLDYASFVYLMSKAYLILTDSGGIQEEAPALGKPVLVMRNTTERPEAVEAGTAKLVGTEVEAITEAVSKLLDDQKEYIKMSNVKNPYGDGRSSEMIVSLISDYYSAFNAHH